MIVHGVVAHAVAIGHHGAKAHDAVRLGRHLVVQTESFSWPMDWTVEAGGSLAPIFISLCTFELEFFFYLSYSQMLLFCP